MPIIACVGMSLIIYLLLFYSLRKHEQQGMDKRSLAINEFRDEKEICLQCHRSYKKSLRYCPYCGDSKGKRVRP